VSVWPAVRLAYWVLVASAMLAGWSVAVGVYVVILDYLLTR
jgi:hypothetical protein